MPPRAGFYFDGFNMYHALDALGRQHLKWLNLWQLSQSLIGKKQQTLEKVVFCTAVKTDGDNGKMLRHRAYLKALQNVGVTCLKGHFAKERRECKGCKTQWDAPVEKCGDVNLAIAAINDAHLNVYDHCYIVTADSDQASTAEMLRAMGKTVTVVAPPTKRHSQAILKHADHSISITEDYVGASLFGRLVPGSSAVSRPLEYEPPKGWTAPIIKGSAPIPLEAATADPSDAA